MFWKKKEKKQENNIILGMVILRDESSFQLKTLIEDYNKHYNADIQPADTDQSSTVLSICGKTIGVMFLDIPIPWGDLEHTAPYAYIWPSALEELSDHKGHVIVSIMENDIHPVKGFKILTQVICSILRTTDSIGVYKGTQSLLLPKGFYLDQAERMNEKYLPLELWIYFGIRSENKGNSGYTYGLKSFHKKEMEILYSYRSLSEIRNFLFHITHYVIGHDVELMDGQTCGFSEQERVSITLSKGKLLAGDTLKLAY